MRKFAAIILALLTVVSLCACGKKDTGDAERECGVYIKMEASDVYAVSYGTDQGSESFENADKSPIKVGESIHFDFAGDKADSTEKAEIEYSICIYDSELNVIAIKSFVDDFSNHAKVNITVTEDHKIINANAGSCGGDVVVEMEDASAEDSVSYMVPKVTMPDRADAADTMNTNITTLNERFTNDLYTAYHERYVQNIGDGTAEGLSAFSMGRTVRTERADSAVVSLRVVDRASLGTENLLNISGHCFNSQTGEELKLSDLGENESKIVNAVSEDILVSFNDDPKYQGTFFNEGYSETIKSLVSDGHWYLSDEGFVVIANEGEIADAANGFYEFTVSYDKLKSVIDEKFIPAEREGSEGNVSVEFAADANEKDLTVLGSAAATDIKSLLVSASGSVYDVCVYTINYNAASGAYTPLRQVLFCSDMSDGAALAINTELTDTTPTLAIFFNQGDGTNEVRLLSLDDSGAVKVTDPNGSAGTVITSRLPYTGDLNGDGKDETVSTSTDAQGLTVISVEANGETSEVTTGVKSVHSIRLYDLDNDGVREIYIDGTDANSASITCAVMYSPSDKQPLHMALFDSQSYAEGLFKEFGEAKLVLDTEVNILGTYKVKSTYSLSDKSFTKDSGELSFDNNNEYVTTSKSITLSNGSLLKSGTQLRFTSTDGSSVINFVTDGGFTGSISISNDGSGWKIAGQPDTSYFTSLPYKN